MKHHDDDEGEGGDRAAVEDAGTPDKHDDGIVGGNQDCGGHDIHAIPDQTVAGEETQGVAVSHGGSRCPSAVRRRLLLEI